MAEATTTTQLYVRLNTELISMVEQFTNLIKGTKEGLEADEAPQRGDRPDSGGLGGSRDRRVPGELLEVLVEKLLAAGHQCVHTISELKKGAVISDFELLTSNIQDVYMSLQTDTYNMTRGLDHIRREAEGLLERLEEHYYASAHKGPQPQATHPDPAAATLAELCAQAQAMIDDMHV